MSTPSPHWLQMISPCPRIPPVGYPTKSLCNGNPTPVNWVEPKRIIYDHELMLFKRGGYRTQIEDEVFDSSENSFIIIPPNRWHISSNIDKGYIHYVHFDWQYMPHNPDTPVMTFFPAPPQHSCFHLAPDIVPTSVFHGTIRSPTVVYNLAERLSFMLNSDNAHKRLASRGVLLELLIHLLDPQPRQTPHQPHQKELAYTVRNLLDKTMSQPNQSISIRTLLESLGQSYEHLARVFRQQYGLTPMNYIQSIRIERAKHFLHHTDMKILAVAQAVGYQDAAYFTQLFKQNTDLSPGKFRQLLQT
ncbi:MAG: helix-turn-helix transcriptional regulator [Phycisphaeraceae bacterium]|nr:helix-turn-helix transcriptional regulator [Phycisphaeraceae bacterium]